MDQPAPTKTISWKRILLTVLVVSIFLAFIVWLYWFFVLNKPVSTSQPAKVSTPSAKQATPSAEEDETADWNVYENTSYNYSENTSYSYSLRYPNELRVFSNDPQGWIPLAATPHLLLTNDPSMNINRRVQPSDIPKSYSLLEIVVFYNKSKTEFKNYSLIDVANIDYGDNKGHAKSVTPLKKITFAGEDAYIYQTVGSTSFTFLVNGWSLKDESLKIIITEHKDNIYCFIYRPDEKIEKVVSTFKFLD